MNLSSLSAKPILAVVPSTRLPIMRLYLTVRVYAAPDGKHHPERPPEYQDLGPCTYYRRYRARSFVKGFGHMLIKSFGCTATLTQNDTGGSSRTLQAPASFATTPPTIWNTGGAAAAQTNTGVLVGTTNTAVTMGDTAMAALVAHGTSASQLFYNAGGSPSVPITSGSDITQVVRRSFSNVSGGTIVVVETGIAAQWYDTGGTARFFLIVRDVVSAINVLNYSTLAVDYAWKTSL